MLTGPVTYYVGSISATLAVRENGSMQFSAQFGVVSSMRSRYVFASERRAAAAGPPSPACQAANLRAKFGRQGGVSDKDVRGSGACLSREPWRLHVAGARRLEDGSARPGRIGRAGALFGRSVRRRLGRRLLSPG